MDDLHPRQGNIVIGVMLVLIGLALALDRAGVIAWTGHWTLWPVILIGIGLASFVQSPPGAPKRGLLFMIGGLWLLGGEMGLVSLANSWPLLVVAFGVVIALNGGRRRRYDPTLPGAPGATGEPGGPAGPGEPTDPWRRARRARRHERHLTPLAVIGIWIAIVVAVQVSGIRTLNIQSGSSDRLQLVSVMGRSEHTSTATAFHGAGVTNVMGRSELDLRSATIAPGAEASVEVFSVMGGVVVRVPPGWAVDTTGLPAAMGMVRDDRFPPSDKEKETAASTGPPPRLVLRGLVLMGRLVIAS